MFARLKKFAPIVGFLFGLCAPLAAFAQTTASLLPNAVQQYFKSDGTPAALGQIFYYVPNTTTLKNTWKDSAMTQLNANPLPLDAAGRPDSNGAGTFGTGSYRQLVKDADGNTIWDAVTTAPGTGSTPTAWGEGVMVGTIIAWTNPVLPSKYLYTDGAAVSRSTYSDLMTAITYSQTILCQIGVATITVSTTLSDIIPIGAPIEASCFAPGTVVNSKAAGSLTLSTNATVTASVSMRAFPWGNGNGSTTFNVPSINGRTLVGRNNMGGTPGSALSSSYYLTPALVGVNPNAMNAVAGSQSHAQTIAEMAAHSHGITDPGHRHVTASTTAWAGTTVTSALAATGAVSGIVGQLDLTGVNTANAVTGITGTQSTGTGSAFTIVQPSITVDYIIKALPDDLPSGPGVTSIQGMTGALTCGGGLTCTAQTLSVSVTIPPPTAVTLGGVFSSTAPANNFARGIDTSGNVLYAQPAFSNISGTVTTAQGGCGAAMTPSAGGIMWTDATQCQVLAGTATARLPLLSGNAATPVWGAFTIPASVTSGGVPYFSSTTVMQSSALLTANAFMIGGGAGSPPTAVAITGLVLGNGASAPTAYAGASCTNQFVRALSAAGAATCATVSLTADVTGVTPIANGGTGQATAAAARGSSGLNIESIQTTGDAAVVIAATTRMQATTTTLTAARAWTLPAANAVNPGQCLIISDKAGAINGANVIDATRAGGDTINGSTVFQLTAQYQQLEFCSDGTSAWTVNPASTGGGTGTVTSVGTAGLATGGSITTSGTVTVTAATQADMETATSTTTAVVPGRVQYHPGVAKAWGRCTNAAGTYTLSVSYNISGGTCNKTGTGELNPGFTTAFSGTSYVCLVSLQSTNTTAATGPNTGSDFTISIRNLSSAATDSTVQFVCYGDQ